MKRIYSKILLLIKLIMDMMKKGAAKVVLSISRKTKKSQARPTHTRAKETYVKALILLNISILLMAIAILAITLGTMTNPPLDIIVPTSGNSTEPVTPITPSNSSSNQPQTPTNSSGSGSNIHVEPTPSNGSNQQPSPIVEIGVYGIDPSGGQLNASGPIDWSVDGPILPGQGRNSSRVYLRNEGNVPVTLQLSSQNWFFENYLGDDLNATYQQYFSLTWDYDNSPLQVNQVKPVIFTLTVSPEIVDVATFSFDITIIVDS